MGAGQEGDLSPGKFAVLSSISLKLLNLIVSQHLCNADFKRDDNLMKRKPGQSWELLSWIIIISVFLSLYSLWALLI